MVTTAYQFWTPQRSEAAAMLAAGATYGEVARQVNVTKKTVYNWMQDVEFAAEVDKLSLMVGIASRAQRLRYANRTILKQLNEDGSLHTEKDVLDWIKYAQSETDGAKLDLSKLAELLAGESGGSGPDGPSGPAMKQLTTAIDVTASGSGDEQLQAQDVAGPDNVFNPS